MKKTLIVLGCLTLAMGAYARPHGCPPPAPIHHHWHGPHHHGDFWGRGGRNFWPGFVGGVIGGALTTAVIDRPTVVAPTVVTTPAVVAAPTVVTSPTVVAPTVVTAPATATQTVWVEGCYVDQVQANGTILRTWVPGHYEQRAVAVQ